MMKKALKKVCLDLVIRDIVICNTQEFVSYSKYHGYEILNEVSFEDFTVMYKHIHKVFHKKMELDFKK